MPPPDLPIDREQKGVAQDDPRLRFLSLEKAAEPVDGFCRIIKDRWWCVHPERGLIFFSLNKRHRPGSPQCNASEQLARSIGLKLYPWAEIRHMPVVYMDADPRDYQ